jgi:hypothetical protein
MEFGTKQSDVTTNSAAKELNDEAEHKQQNGVRQV